MKAQAFSIDLLVAIFILLSIFFVSFLWRYEEIDYIKAYDFAAIIHKTNFTNTAYLESLESEYNISISIFCPNYTYVSERNANLFVERIAWHDGICKIKVGI